MVVMKSDVQGNDLQQFLRTRKGNLLTGNKY